MGIFNIAINPDGNLNYLFNETQKDVALISGGTQPSISDYRLSILYYVQTDQSIDRFIGIFPFNSTFYFETPDSVRFYIGPPVDIPSIDLPAGVYTVNMTGTTEYTTDATGAGTVINSGDTLDDSWLTSLISNAGDIPGNSISAGDWTFNLRGRTGDLTGVNEIKWNVYKSTVHENISPHYLYTTEEFLFSGSTGDLTSVNYTEYNTIVNYANSISFI